MLLTLSDYHFLKKTSYSCNVITKTDVCLVKSINPKLKYAQFYITIMASIVTKVLLFSAIYGNVIHINYIVIYIVLIAL